MAEHSKWSEHSEQAGDSGARHTKDTQGDHNRVSWVGQNPGERTDHVGSAPGQQGKVVTAYDIKNLSRRLEGFSDDDLRRIPVLPVGSTLEQGGSYIDLRHPEPVQFTATTGMEARYDTWYVHKGQVEQVLWERLNGVEKPEW